MQLVFKQTLANGLVHTTTVTDKDGYISVQPHSDKVPVVYEGLDILQFHLLGRGDLPMHYRDNTSYFVREAQWDSVARNVPPIQHMTFPSGRSFQEEWEYWNSPAALAPENLMESARRTADLLELLLAAGEVYWKEAVAKLRSIPDGTYWLTPEPVTDVFVTIAGEHIPCAIGYDNTYLEIGDAEYRIFQSREDAGEGAIERWLDMMEHDPKEFVCIVGESVLVNWALGRPDGPGSDKSSRSAKEWIYNVVASHPEEELASYDGLELEAKLSSAAAELFGLEPDVVLYRCN